MRPRIRTIKPEAHTDEALWDAEEETKLPLFRAYSGLWCHADREGRFEWRPRPLKAGVLPYWDGDFSRVLDALATRGFVVRYVVDGREYGVIPSFGKHQSINNKEEASRLPPPPVVSKSSEDLRASTTREPRDDDANATPLFPTQGEGKGTEGKGEEHACDASEPPAPASSVKPSAASATHIRRFEQSFVPPTPVAIMLPADFEPSDANRDQAARASLDLDLELQRYRNWCASKGRTSCAWQADFSNWLLQAVKHRRQDADRAPANTNNEPPPASVVTP